MNIHLKSSFDDLPDLVLFNLFFYFKSGDLIYTFYNYSLRLNQLLYEKHYLTNLNLSNLSLKQFLSICNENTETSIFNENVLKLCINELYSCNNLKILNSNNLFQKLSNLKSIQLIATQRCTENWKICMIIVKKLKVRSRTLSRGLFEDY
ncbi:unnamed protein product [Didymodactylos carnosus]|uniref:F-box domain-containing protein n=1 Tax=Didymodactylos carnosus TaxID=1234261 RepID=A0A814GL98_9BILA|nr:unnamed protein product [Didymodactylos carnosus]CAF3769409.1 unnamed protein product [Didymodactylos carnosus]